MLVDALDAQTETVEVRRRLGVLPDSRGLYKRLTARENVELASQICRDPLDADEVLAHGSFSWHVLTSLTDDVHVFNDGIEFEGAGPVVGISLTSRRTSSAR